MGGGRPTLLRTRPFLSLVVYLKGFSPSLFPSPKTLQGETFKLHFVEKVFVGEGEGW